jgi:molybdopterin-containing oxidoreductase family membrane subunit
MKRPADVIDPALTAAAATEKISGIVLGKFRKSWIAGFLAAFFLLNVMMLSIGWLLLRGVGVWGINIPVAWGFAIINFVWWIGIGHAGTFISAFLVLLRQSWRTSINRFAEAMTLFAVASAGIFPLLHIGRPQFFYWLLPYPNTMGIWPQFRSPLVWDVFAVTVYLTVSLLFWYVGLIPDMAVMRDRARRPWIKRVYGFLALGWNGEARHWFRYETAYVLLAGLATPLVISVHSIVSLDFAVSVVPGWTAEIFPPYFVAGALFSGFAMVLILVIPLRKIYGLEGMITLRHLNAMAKVMLASGLIVTYGYSMEIFSAWYGESPYERFVLLNRVLGPYAPVIYVMIACNVILPQFLWSSRVRNNPLVLFMLALVVNTGMWCERFVIIVTSLHRDYLPSSWGVYFPSFWDIALFLGTIGLFFTLLFLFIRVLPMISISEVQALIHEREEEKRGGRRD